MNTSQSKYSFVWAVAVAILSLPQHIASAQWSGASSTATTDPATFALVTARWFLALLIILSIIGILIGSILIVSAGGDDDRVAAGRQALIFSGVSILLMIIGFIILGIYS